MVFQKNYIKASSLTRHPAPFKSAVRKAEFFITPGLLPFPVFYHLHKALSLGERLNIKIKKNNKF